MTSEWHHAFVMKYSRHDDTTGLGRLSHKICFKTGNKDIVNNIRIVGMTAK